MNTSTITIGANTKHTVSIMFSVGNGTILNISLSCGINKTTNINAAETTIASIKIQLLNIPLVNIDFLLFLTLNTWTSSESESTMKAIVCAIDTLTCSEVNPYISGTFFVFKPTINAANVRKPIMQPW